MQHCRALTKKGTPCSRLAVNDTGYCWQHQFMAIGSQPVMIAAPVSPLITALQGLSLDSGPGSFPVIVPVNPRRLLPPMINPANNLRFAPRVTFADNQQLPPKIDSPRKTPQSPPKIDSPRKTPQLPPKIASPVKIPQSPPKISSPRKTPQSPSKIASPINIPRSPPKIATFRGI